MDLVSGWTIFRFPGHQYAFAARVVAQTVEGALEVAVENAAHRQPGGAVGAAVGEDARLAVRAAPDHEPFIQCPHPYGLSCPKLAGLEDGIPVVA
jgi:hypothetical protein